MEIHNKIIIINRTSNIKSSKQSTKLQSPTEHNKHKIARVFKYLHLPLWIEWKFTKRPDTSSVSQRFGESQVWSPESRSPAQLLILVKIIIIERAESSISYISYRIILLDLKSFFYCSQNFSSVGTELAVHDVDVDTQFVQYSTKWQEHTYPSSPQKCRTWQP